MAKAHARAAPATITTLVPTLMPPTATSGLATAPATKFDAPNTALAAPALARSESRAMDVAAG